MGAERLRALARVSVAAALGKDRALRREIRAALNAGASTARLDETLLQLIPFAGYARSINAFAVLQEIAPTPPGPRARAATSAAAGRRSAAASTAPSTSA